MQEYRLIKCSKCSLKLRIKVCKEDFGNEREIICPIGKGGCGTKKKITILPIFISKQTSGKSAKPKEENPRKVMEELGLGGFDELFGSFDDPKD